VKVGKEPFFSFEFRGVDFHSSKPVDEGKANGVKHFVIDDELDK